MEIENNDFDNMNDDEVEDIIDDELIMDSDDDSDEIFVKTEKSKTDIRRRLDEYFEDVKLKREIDYY
ncbi:MAG: hypothetical protein OEW99_07905 [Gammaproteobacteria bacterium]|nr:hypothetical protein [Gammaproteobacteria bacterium]